MIPSQQRRSVGEMWGVSVWFECGGVPAPLLNLSRFAQGVRAQGLKLLIVELAFGTAPFRIPQSFADKIVRLRAADVMWQKECLINQGISHLPPACDKVVWLDADILFENDDWVAGTRRALEEFAVVQPFESVCWLAEGESEPPRDPPAGMGEGHVMLGMASTMSAVHDKRRALADFFAHGHTGFAWAARRDILARNPLYDRHVLGGGDVTIAHSFYGDADYWRGLNMFCRNLTKKEVAAIGDWGRRIHADVQGSVSFVPGRIRHLWHGPMSKRGYGERGRILKENDFDPQADVATDAEGCLRWASDKPGLQAGVRGYFQSRAAMTVEA